MSIAKGIYEKYKGEEITLRYQNGTSETGIIAGYLEESEVNFDYLLLSHAYQAGDMNGPLAWWVNSYGFVSDLMFDRYAKCVIRSMNPKQYISGWHVDTANGRDFCDYIEIPNPKAYPNKCPKCSKPAYIGFSSIDCSAKCGVR